MLSQIQRTPALQGHQSHNLWQEALASLDDELKATLNFRQADKRNILDAAIKAAQEKKHLCLQKGWKFKRPNGEEVVLRDVCEKIIAWLDKFKAVGDVAVQYDPAHASLAWAGVRFLLQVVVSDKKIFAGMVEGLETISRLITRYAIFEDLYMQRDSTTRNDLEGALIGLYAHILIFLAKAKRYFQTGAAKRVIKSAFQPEDDQHMRKIVAQEVKISELARLADAEALRHTSDGVMTVRNLLQTLNRPISRLTDQATISVRTLQENNYLNLLRWLSSVPYSRHHERHAEIRIPGTGQWLLDHSQHVEWRSSSASSILLLHGALGSGKTSLASAIVDSFLEENSRQASPAPLSYFYCAKNAFEPERADPEEIMRSIVRQLSSSGNAHRQVHDLLLTEYERREAESKVDGFEVPRMRISECTKLILDITRSNPAIIIVDAVDELQETRQYELLHALKQITKDSASVVKVFITSRDHSNIFAQLSAVQKIRIDSDETQGDMELFVRHHVALATQNQRLLKGNVSEELQEDLVEALRNGAQEMFLWVTLQIDNLCRMKLEVDVRKAMQQLSQDTLNKLYTESFRRISAAETYARNLALQTFSWLLCMQEALAPTAFVAAVAMANPELQLEPTLSALVDVCSNLIVLDSKLNVLRFAHVSVQEFLEMKPEFALDHVHRVAAISCLNICMRGIPVMMESAVCQTDAFYHYGALFWAEHSRVACVTDRNDELLLKMQEFVFEEGEISMSFIDWVDEVRRFAEALRDDHPLKKPLGAVPNSAYTPLFTACVFGLANLVEDMGGAKDFDWNQKNDQGHTGLYLASRYGFDDIVRISIKHGADVNAIGGQYGNPMHAACFAGHIDVVRLLLEYGADPHAGGTFENAFQASLLGDREEIAQVLMENSYQILNQYDYNSALHQAAQAGSTKIVRLLQKTFAASFEQNVSARRSAVEAAIFKGQQGVLNQFLRKPPGPHSDLLKNALSTAALGGQNSMVLQLLERGLDIKAEGRFGTPLRAASLMGHESTARLLIDHGANVKTCGVLGDAIQASAMKGHVLITKLLIREGAAVNNQGGLYGNALQAAAFRGHQKVVTLLLDAGADVHRQGLYRDAFHAAAEGGQEGVLHQILGRGFKFRHPPPPPMCRLSSPSPYKVLLREASPSRIGNCEKKDPNISESGNLSECNKTSDYRGVIRSLKDMGGADRHEHIVRYPKRLRLHATGNEEDNYALQVAAAKGHDSVVKFILETWDFLAISAEEVGNALIESSTNGHEKVVEHLLSGKLDMTPHLAAALEGAASHGHVTIVNMLLACQETFEPPLDYKHMLQVLIAGCRGGHLPVVATALEALGERCSAALQCSARHDALHTAANHGNGNIIKMLLSSKAQTHFPRTSPVMRPHEDTADFADSVVRPLKIARKGSSSPMSLCNYCSSRSSFPEHAHRPHYELFGPPTAADDLSHAFNASCGSGHKSVLLALIEGDTRNFLKHQAYEDGLELASKNGHEDVVHFLLGRPSEYYSSILLEKAIINASTNGFVETVRLLLRIITNGELHPDVLNRSLNVASYYGHRPVADLLIREGADVNAGVDEVGHVQNELLDHAPFELFRRTSKPEGKITRNALQAALQGFDRFRPSSHRYDTSPYNAKCYKADKVGQEATIHLLLQQGAEVNASASDLIYPLYTASALCSEITVQSLIDKGADVKLTSGDRGTALLAAASREISAGPVTRILVQAGAVIPARATDAVTALNAALAFFEPPPDGRFAQSESIQAVLNDGPGAVLKILLAHLPEEKANDKRYGLLLQMAAMAEDHDCVDLLLQRQVNVNVAGCYYGSALQAAARAGSSRILHRLLHAGADVNLLGGADGTALRAAVLGPHTEAVAVLIKHGADVNLRAEMRGNYNTGNGSALQTAVQVGSLNIVQLLLAAGADVNADPESSGQVLSTACCSGDDTMVQLLLSKGAKVNASAEPLHIASARGHEAVVRTLLSHGADTEKAMGDTGTPLRVAAYAGHLSTVQLLINAGANVNNSTNDTALSVASHNGHLAVVQELLESGASIVAPPRLEVPNLDKNSWMSEFQFKISGNALAAACRSRHRPVVEFLLGELSGTAIEESVCADSLSSACASSDDELCQLLLDHGVPQSPATLCQAAAAGLEGSVRVLLQNGVDVNGVDGDGGHALHAAACHLQWAIVTLLLDYGADIHMQSERYGSPLLAALEGWATPALRTWARYTPAKSLAEALPLPAPPRDIFNFRGTDNSLPSYKDFIDCEQVVEILLNRGADVNTEMRDFGNALHLASFMGKESIVRLLLDKGGNINSYGGHFESALVAALAGGHPAIVELLLEKGIEVNAPLSEHGTALHYACSRGAKSAIKLLLIYGADVNARGDAHGSPLAAALHGHSNSWADRPVKRETVKRETVKLLLQYGTKVQIRENDLLATAARDTYDEEFLELLLEYSQDVPITEAIIIGHLESGCAVRGSRILQVLLNRSEGIEVTEAMLKAAANPASMEALLRQSPAIRITPAIIEAAAKKPSGRDLLGLLLAHDSDVRITETAVIDALMRPNSPQNEDIIPQLLNHQGEIKTTAAMIKAVVSVADMKVLLERSPGIHVTTDMLESAATSQDSMFSKDEGLVKLLLEHDRSAQITSAVVSAVIRSRGSPSTAMATLLEHDPDIDFTEDMLLTLLRPSMWYEEPRRVVEVLLRYDKRVAFTDTICAAIKKSHADEGLKLLVHRLRKEEV